MAHFPVDYVPGVNNHVVPEAVRYFDMRRMIAAQVPDNIYQLHSFPSDSRRMARKSPRLAPNIRRLQCKAGDIEVGELHEFLSNSPSMVMVYGVRGVGGWN